MPPRLPCIAALLALSAAAAAGELSVHVVDQRGKPVADAVVTVEGGSARKAAPATRTVDQKDETFVPYVEAFHAGDKVVFRNSDTTRHHVYSFSPVKSFEFVLAPGQSSSALVLDTTGVAAVGCNIHDHMITYLFVTDAPLFARTGADGDARIDDLPEGSWTVRLWHPQLRGKAPPAQPLQVSTAQASAHQDFAVSLLPDPRVRQDLERSHY